MSLNFPSWLLAQSDDLLKIQQFTVPTIYSKRVTGQGNFVLPVLN